LFEALFSFEIFERRVAASYLIILSLGNKPISSETMADHYDSVDEVSGEEVSEEEEVVVKKKKRTKKWKVCF
jgi:hypothetical protein